MFYENEEESEWSAIPGVIAGLQDIPFTFSTHLHWVEYIFYTNIGFIRTIKYKNYLLCDCGQLLWAPVAEDENSRPGNDITKIDTEASSFIILDTLTSFLSK
jgi:hypothetical protein